jgi:hypothetical protein
MPGRGPFFSAYWRLVSLLVCCQHGECDGNLANRRQMLRIFSVCFRTSATESMATDAEGADVPQQASSRGAGRPRIAVSRRGEGKIVPTPAAVLEGCGGALMSRGSSRGVSSVSDRARTADPRRGPRAEHRNVGGRVDERTFGPDLGLSAPEGPARPAASRPSYQGILAAQEPAAGNGPRLCRAFGVEAEAAFFLDHKAASAAAAQ